MFLNICFDEGDYSCSIGVKSGKNENAISWVTQQSVISSLDLRLLPECVLRDLLKLHTNWIWGQCYQGTVFMNFSLVHCQNCFSWSGWWYLLRLWWDLLAMCIRVFRNSTFSQTGSAIHLHYWIFSQFSCWIHLQSTEQIYLVWFIWPLLCLQKEDF